MRKTNHFNTTPSTSTRGDSHLDTHTGKVRNNGDVSRNLDIPSSHGSPSKVDNNDRLRRSFDSSQHGGASSGSSVHGGDTAIELSKADRDADLQTKERLSMQGSQDGTGSRTGRTKLLHDYLDAIDRPVDRGEAVKAFKLRQFAEVHFGKSESSRLTPRSMQSSDEVSKLAAMDVDALIQRVKAQPGKYTRSLLTRVAERHFVNALKIDHDAFIKGVEKAAVLEGLHTTAGRGVTLAGTLVGSGVVEAIPGASEIANEGLRQFAKGSRKAAKFLGRQLPSSVINPILTGKLRITTAVKQLGRMEGGQAQLAPNIGTSPDMGAVADNIHAALGALKAANAEFRSVDEADDNSAQLQKMVQAYLDLHAAANDQYKSRIGFNRTQSYGKAYGAGVNAFAATGAIASVALPGVGQVAGPVIQAAAMGAQMGAGYLDKITEQRYSVHANVKWGDFLTEAGKKVPYEQLSEEHIDVDKLRAGHVTHSEMQVIGVRDVYKHQLGKLLAKADRLRSTVEKSTGHEGEGLPSAKLQRQKKALAGLEQQIEAMKNDVRLLESLDPLQWEKIPRDSIIGRCLDDPTVLERLRNRAKHDAVGETARSILQRYDQAFHGGLSAGVMLPVSDALTMVDSLHEDGDESKPLLPKAQAAAMGVGVTGGTVFTAATGEVRVSKAENGTRLKTMVPVEKSRRADKVEQDQATWVFDAGHKSIDLTTTASYDRLYHTRTQRATRLISAAGKSVISSYKGVFNLGEAKLARRDARRVMGETLALLQASVGSDVAAPRRRKNFAAMKHALLAYPEVLKALRAPLNKGKQSVVEPPKPPILKLNETPIDLEVDLEKTLAAKAKVPTKMSTTKAETKPQAKTAEKRAERAFLSEPLPMIDEISASSSANGRGPGRNLSTDMTDQEVMQALARLGIL